MLSFRDQNAYCLTRSKSSETRSKQRTSNKETGIERTGGGITRYKEYKVPILRNRRFEKRMGNEYFQVKNRR